MREFNSISLNKYAYIVKQKPVKGENTVVLENMINTIVNTSSKNSSSNILGKSLKGKI